jgi:hypothetical protein
MCKLVKIITVCFAKGMRDEFIHKTFDLVCILKYDSVVRSSKSLVEIKLLLHTKTGSLPRLRSEMISKVR